MAGPLVANGGQSYPCSIEHEGMLYVGYYNMGERSGNNNNAELAVFPVSALATKAP